MLNLRRTLTRSLQQSSSSPSIRALLDVSCRRSSSPLPVSSLASPPAPRPTATSFSQLQNLPVRLKMSSSASPQPALQQPLKLACIQLASGPDKAANLAHAAAKVSEAASAGAQLVVLPECFNSPYGTQYFSEYAEVLTTSGEPSESQRALSDMASASRVFLVGGSVPEFNPATKKYHNTTLVYGPDGALLATHRKVHLFDIDIPGKISFHESDILSPGNKVTLVDLPGYGTVAIAICYDVRFPELATIAARKNAFALVYPGAFNLTTGPLHWKLLAQARAMDNQIYVAMCSPARDMSAAYHAWGHSMIVDPMAQVLEEAEEKESIVYAELDPNKIAETRRNIPLNTQRRWDVYPDVSKGKVQFEDPDLEDAK